MGYLSGEIFLFLILAFLLGVLVGWWIWGRGGARVTQLEQDSASAQKALEDCQSARQRLEREESAARTKLHDANSRITELEAELAKAQEEASSAAVVAPVAAGLMSTAAPEQSEETKAKLAAGPFLDKPIGVPDDLMLIKGVGPKLSALLHSLGVFHFFQIAGWSEEDVAKVDLELKTFKGRVTRDNWIDQAGLLAAGDHDAFVAKYGEMGENRK